MSAGDVALYAVLCGLAVYPRPALKRQIIDRPNLRGFMEHEPHTKELLDAFWNCEYKKGLGLLAKWKVRSAQTE
jgi:COP9 signalosome complex subunit 1